MPATTNNQTHPDGGPLVLDDCEAWCEECRAIYYVFSPWQDICPRGHWISRTFYDQEDAADETPTN